MQFQTTKKVQSQAYPARTMGAAKQSARVTEMDGSTLKNFKPKAKSSSIISTPNNPNIITDARPIKCSAVSTLESTFCLHLDDYQI